MKIHQAILLNQNQVDLIQSKLALVENDAFVLCAAPEWQADLALESVIKRVRQSYHRISQEVRNVVIRKGAPEDGTTTAMRPLPGGARMYPETDIPVVTLDEKRWSSIRGDLPLNRAQRIERLSSYDISDNQVQALIGAELDDDLVIAVEGEPTGTPGIPAKSMASALLDNTREDIAEGTKYTANTLPMPVLTLSLHACEEGIITREGLIPMAHSLLIEGPTHTEAEFPKRLKWFCEKADSNGYTPADSSAVEDAVDQILADRADFVTERGLGAIGPLMGPVMGKLGGAADGKVVSEILKQKISKIIDE